MTDLMDLVEAYKREVALPGSFESEFPGVTDEMLAGALADAFAGAQLDGFFGSMTLDVEAGTVTPDLSVAGAALVVLYAGMRMIRQQLRSTSTSVRYWAGPVGMDESSSASALAADLKHLEARRLELLAMAQRGVGTSVFVIDGYVTRAASSNYYGGFLPHEAFMPRNWLVG